MNQQVTTSIDQEQCVGCGLCAQVCPLDTITMRGDKAEVTGQASLNCGHCQAVCPAGAVTVGSLDPEQLCFATFDLPNEWLPPGRFPVESLAQLMASRRSCRNYLDRPVSRDMLADLVKVGVSAPSGTNSQRWAFTILPDREAVMALAQGIGSLMARFNRLAEKAWLRGLLSLVGKRELSDYFREHYDSVKRALAEWEKTGRDRLFHGAPAAVVVSSRPGASCPAEDALLASGQMLLAAHAMGLGSCMVGYAVAAMQKEPSLARGLGIAPGEKIYAVIALGWPDEEYQRLTGRLTPLVRWS